MIQIERREAVANLEEMLSIDGVDVACLGYMDLTVDLGIPGQLEHPTAVAAVSRMIDVANANSVAPGIIAGEMATIDQWMSRGMRFISYATEEIMLQQAATQSARELRDLSAKCAGGLSLPNQ